MRICNRHENGAVPELPQYNSRRISSTQDPLGPLLVMPNKQTKIYTSRIQPDHRQHALCITNSLHTQLVDDAWQEILQFLVLGVAADHVRVGPDRCLHLLLIPDASANHALRSTPEQRTAQEMFPSLTQTGSTVHEQATRTAGKGKRRFAAN